MDEALRLGEGVRGRSAPNPNVGCVIVSSSGRIVGRGATARAGGLTPRRSRSKQAGKRAAGAPYTSRWNPAPIKALAVRPAPISCSRRNPSGSSLPSRIPIPARRARESGVCARAGIEVTLGIGRKEATQSLAGWLTRLELGRPRITLKLALSIDGKIALPSGESKWITGEDARRHVHVERAHSDMIVVGRGTYLADQPRLDVRLPGLEQASPRRALLTRGDAVEGWETLRNPQDVYGLHDVNDLLVEGGSSTATAFLTEDLVDRILIYRAPIIVGEGKSSFGYVGLDAIADAHGRWRLVDERRLGVDRLEVYERVRRD